MKKLSVLLVLLFSALFAHANVTLHGIFTDHMVLQRDIPVSVFGTAEPGEKVTVAFSPRPGSGQAGQEKSTTAGKDGSWSVKLDAMKACTNSAAMTVEGKNKLTLNDIVIGDIWVCSGQSNMEFGLGGCNRQEDVSQANFPLMRQFHQDKRASPLPLKDARSSWAVCTPQSAPGFTAVGFYFGRKIHQETGIPIGLIKTAWGGTKIEPWVSPDGLASVSELAEEQKKVENQVKEYREKMASSLTSLETYIADTRKAIANNAELPAMPEIPRQPGSGSGDWHALYNGMIHPYIQFPIKGAIWYQGESNGGEGDSYFQKKRALIGGWRKAWNVGEFPFYFVQLANFQQPNNNPEGGDGWAKVRMAQMKTLTIPNTGMAVIIDLADVGNPGDIHPKNKRDVGERLALWSLARDYGKKDLVYSGPLYREMKVEGSPSTGSGQAKIRIIFDNVDSGLCVATKKGYDPMVKDPQGKLQKFAIAGEDKKWVWADAVIDGKTVVVSSPGVPKPVAVRYAFTMNPDGCNLYNNEGLPASPFRTDDW